MKKLLLFMFCIISIKSLAATDGGGGNAVKETLLDFYEGNIVDNAYEELREINVMELDAVKRYLVPIQEEISAEFANWDFFYKMKEGRQSKKWFFTNNPLPSKALGLTEEVCLNDSSKVSAKPKIIACQDKEKVVIYEPWFKSTTGINQAGAIAHELLIEKYYSKFDSRRNLENFVRNAIHYIFNNRGNYLTNNSRNQTLVSVLGKESSNPGIYEEETFIYPLENYRSELDLVAKLYGDLDVNCSSDGTLLDTPSELFEKAAKGYRLARDGRLTAVMQDRIFSWARALHHLSQGMYGKFDYDRNLPSKLCSLPINYLVW